ncbi:hypothetical protein E2320_006860, partial [Naja naja]
MPLAPLLLLPGHFGPLVLGSFAMLLVNFRISITSGMDMGGNHTSKDQGGLRERFQKVALLPTGPQARVPGCETGVLYLYKEVVQTPRWKDPTGPTVKIFMVKKGLTALTCSALPSSQQSDRQTDWKNSPASYMFQGGLPSAWIQHWRITRSQTRPPKILCGVALFRDMQTFFLQLLRLKSLRTWDALRLARACGKGCPSTAKQKKSTPWA